MFLFCLTSGVAVWYNAKYIKQNARIGERNERSDLFPLSYAVCGCSANMALTDLIDRRRIGRRGGILWNKKRYPSKLRRPALHHDSFAAATWLRCRGLRRRVTKNNCLPALWPRSAGSAEAVITVYNGRSLWPLAVEFTNFRRCFCCASVRRQRQL